MQPHRCFVILLVIGLVTLMCVYELKENATAPNTRALMTFADDVMPAIMQFLQPEAYTHFYNVCFEASHRIQAIIHPFQAQLTAYDNRKRMTSYTFHVDTVKGETTNFWKIHMKSGEIPNDAVYKDAIMYFPTYWRDSPQIFLFLSIFMPRTLGQIKWTKQRGLLTTTLENNQLLMAPKLHGMPKTHQETLAVLGIRKTKDFLKMVKRNVSVCFSNAVFGETAQWGREREVRELLEQRMNLSACTQYYVTFLQRQSTRKILNINQLMDLAKRAGLKNIRLEYFEGKTIPEQMRIIHCTAVYVGVQGAALTWYAFLPRNAVLLEILYPGWPMRYQKRANWNRPDIKAITVHCDRVTPDAVWEKYARLWYNYSGHIDGNMKLKLAKQSETMYPVGKSVYKDSNCKCSNQTFMKALLEVVSTPINHKH